jgi:hypothetical protein
LNKGRITSSYVEEDNREIFSLGSYAGRNDKNTDQAPGGDE